MSQPRSVLVLGSPGSETSRLRRLLARQCLLIESAADIDEARALMRRCHFDRLILVDPPGPWNSLQRALQQCEGLPSAILLIADADRQAMAIDALRSGASDALLRPFSSGELLSALATRAGNKASPSGRATDTGRRLVGESRSMQAVKSLIERIAPTPATVLVQGESGTGKELVARLLHETSGREGPFVPINCSAVAPDLLESELFGRAPGAIRGPARKREGLFVAAAGGTLFLDEIHEIPLDLGVKLLRALEENAIRPVGSSRELPIDCRIVASTPVDLAELVEHGRFREDLYDRLNVIRIEVPPLRDRRQDIPRLAAHFVASLSADMGMSPVELESGHVAELEAYDWPGNVRELRNVVERTLLLGRPPTDSLQRPVRRSAPPEYPLDWTLEQVKRHHMARILEASGGNKSAAARRLGVSRKTLERKLGTKRRK